MGHSLAFGYVINYSHLMDKILISGCLMGQPVRYDGAAKSVANPHLARWQKAGQLIAFCPEIAGGFTVPRLPAEIEPGATAQDVLNGAARIWDSHRNDVTPGFLNGARAALNVALKAGCRHAILMDGSPSCGSGSIYSGHFDGEKRDGIGVTCALLIRHGIRVWQPAEIDDLANTLSLK